MSIEAHRGNSDQKHVVWEYLTDSGTPIDAAYNAAYGPMPVMIEDDAVEGYLEYLRVYVQNEGRKHIQRDVNAADTMRCHALRVLGRPVTSIPA